MATVTLGELSPMMDGTGRTASTATVVSVVAWVTTESPSDGTMSLLGQHVTEKSFNQILIGPHPDLKTFWQHQNIYSRLVKMVNYVISFYL